MRNDTELAMLKAKQEIEKSAAKRRRGYETFVGKTMHGKTLVATDGHCALFRDGADPAASKMCDIGPIPSECFRAEAGTEFPDALKRLCKVFDCVENTPPKITLNGEVEYRVGNVCFEHVEHVTVFDQSEDIEFIVGADPNLVKLGTIPGRKTMIEYVDKETAFWVSPVGAGWSVLVMPCKTR